MPPAASRTRRARCVLLYVIEPDNSSSGIGVRQVQLEEETNKAKALFRLFRRKLQQRGLRERRAARK